MIKINNSQKVLRIASIVVFFLFTVIALKEARALEPKSRIQMYCYGLADNEKPTSAIYFLYLDSKKSFYQIWANQFKYSGSSWSISQGSYSNTNDSIVMVDIQCSFKSIATIDNDTIVFINGCNFLKGLKFELFNDTTEGIGKLPSIFKNMNTPFINGKLLSKIDTVLWSRNTNCYHNSHSTTIRFNPETYEIYFLDLLGYLRDISSGRWKKTGSIIELNDNDGLNRFEFFYIDSVLLPRPLIDSIRNN